MTISAYRQLPLSVRDEKETKEAVNIMLANESIKRSSPLAPIPLLEDGAGIDEIRGRMNDIIDVLNAITARGA